MEINQNEKLSTISEKLEQLQLRISELEEKVAELQDKAGITTETAISEPIDIMADEVSFVVPSRKEEFSAKPEVSKPSPTPAKPAVAPKPEVAPKPAARKPASYSWQTATAAAPLTNILSGIALKERGIFINTLFKEDAQLFMDTITAFNAMGSLSEALDYIEAHFPEWNLASDIVYKLMMAVRRRLN